MTDKFEMLTFQQFENDNGKLVILEKDKPVPFDVKRMFYIFDKDTGVVRGMQANIHSQFVLINLNGSCKVKLHDGAEETSIILDQPNQGVFMKPMVWREISDISKGSILLELSDQVYDAGDCIKDFNEFVKKAGMTP